MLFIRFVTLNFVFAASGTFHVSCPVVDLKTSILGCCRAGEGILDSCEGGCALCDCV